MAIDQIIPPNLPLDAVLLQSGEIASMQTLNIKSGLQIAPISGTVAGVFVVPMDADMDADTLITVEAFRRNLVVVLGSFTVSADLDQLETGYFNTDNFAEVDSGDLMYCKTDGAQGAATAATIAIVLR